MTQIVTKTFSQWLRDKGASTDDIGDATDFAHAADVVDYLSEALAEVVRVTHGSSALVARQANRTAYNALTRVRGEAE